MKQDKHQTKYSHHQTKYIGKEVGLRTYQPPCTYRALPAEIITCRLYVT